MLGKNRLGIHFATLEILHRALNLRQVKVRSALCNHCMHWPNFSLAEIEASIVVRGQIPFPDAFIFVKERHLTPEVLFTVSEEIERAALISWSWILVSFSSFTSKYHHHNSQPSAGSNLSSSVGRVRLIFRLFRPILGRPLFPPHFGSPWPGYDGATFLPCPSCYPPVKTCWPSRRVDHCFSGQIHISILVCTYWGKPCQIITDPLEIDHHLDHDFQAKRWQQIRAVRGERQISRRTLRAATTLPQTTSEIFFTPAVQVQRSRKGREVGRQDRYGLVGLLKWNLLLLNKPFRLSPFLMLM